METHIVTNETTIKKEVVKDENVNDNVIWKKEVVKDNNVNDNVVWMTREDFADPLPITERNTAD